MSTERYCKKVWLNKEDSPASGSMVCFDGEVRWREKPDVTSYIEIADCQTKIKIHRIYEDTEDDYIEKIILMRNTLNDFIQHLQAKNKNKKK
jgi:hypothetical protein